MIMAMKVAVTKLISTLVSSAVHQFRLIDNWLFNITHLKARHVYFTLIAVLTIK
jgi:hypothetical protein